MTGRLCLLRRILPKAIARSLYFWRKLMIITVEQCCRSFPTPAKKAGVFTSALNLAIERFQINNRLRILDFIAQVRHESGRFN